MTLWDPYKALLGEEVVDQLYQLASILKGVKIVHVNSTRLGGGVSEILTKMVPLTQALGLETGWEVIKGDQQFFESTKSFHNSLQGTGKNLPEVASLRYYEEINRKNAEELKGVLEEANIVFIHDPQPLPLIDYFPKRKGKWVWRCHLEISNAPKQVWHYLKKYVDQYDARIFSQAEHPQGLPNPVYIIAPSIDPFSEKNIELSPEEVAGVYKKFAIDTKRPILLQVSRFDRFKDPVGVIEAYRLTKKYHSGVQLVLAGDMATDDPEGAEVLAEVKAAADSDKDIHILCLPSEPRTINALQRGADIVIQKSVKEGFGLTVTEALWKAKPVIGGNTGGIRLQVINDRTGFLVNTPEEAANKIRYLLQNPEKGKELGLAGKQHVKDHYLITRHLRDYLTVMINVLFPN